MPKICPICNKEWPDDFMACPLDGSALVSKPQQLDGFNLNLGDANAISGGINLSDNHSTFNTTTSHVDSHNVITNNITQVERNKSPEELKHEKEVAFREECLKVYSNGIMTSEEKFKLKDLQYRLGLDDSSADQILSDTAKRSERKSSTLSSVHQITYNNIKKAIKANSLDMVNRLMAQMKAMVQRYSVEEIQFTYYMLQAILHPKECVEEYESHSEDLYWQVFWSSIAYRRIGNIEKSELLVADVSDKWPDTFSQENVFLLASVNSLMDRDTNVAKSLYDNVNGEYSPLLSDLATCLYSLFYGDMLSSEDYQQCQKDSLFYIDKLFAEISAENLKKRHLEEEERRLTEERNLEEERKLSEEKRIAEERRLTEEKRLQAQIEKEQQIDVCEQETSAVAKQYDSRILASFSDKFGYLRKLEPSEIDELKSALSLAPEDDYKALFYLGQLYVQEGSSAVCLKKAYDALKKASEHGVYEAGAFMAYFYLHGKVVLQNLDEAERRIKLDNDYKLNPIFIQMMVDLYMQKGNSMLADVWKSRLSKIK